MFSRGQIPSCLPSWEWAGWLRRNTRKILRDSTKQGQPTVRLVRLAQDRLGVVKEYLDQPEWFRSTAGRFIMGREAAAYRRLEGCRGVVGLLGQPTPDSLLLEYVEGVPVCRLKPGELPAAALEQMQDILEAMHARGVVHCDLGHDSNGDFGRDTNLIWSRDGRLYVIDFAGALLGKPPTAAGTSLYQAMLMHDRLVLTKLVTRFFPDLRDTDHHRFPSQIPPWAWRMFRFFKKL
ncbi:MAG: hypothetical protein HY319_31815 [Armatimonadetes bacterium]|nr:hypothetical protein [Armatimonadota bacterium]